MECCLISAAKEHEKNKERKSKDYGRSKAKKKKKKKKRTKPGKAFFFCRGKYFIFFCLLPSPILLRAGIADKTISFIYQLVLILSLRSN